MLLEVAEVEHVGLFGERDRKATRGLEAAVFNRCRCYPIARRTGNAGVDAWNTGRGAARAEAHDAGLVSVARRVVHDERPAAVALTGVYTAFGDARTDHSVVDNLLSGVVDKTRIDLIAVLV